MPDYLGKNGTKGYTESIVLPLSDETSDLETGDAVYSFFLPYNLTVDKIYASLNTQCAGSSVIVDIKRSGMSIFDTQKIEVPTNSDMNTVQPDYSTGLYFPQFSKIVFNIDQVGSTTAGQGLKVMLIGHRTVDTEF